MAGRIDRASLAPGLVIVAILAALGIGTPLLRPGSPSGQAAKAARPVTAARPLAAGITYEHSAVAMLEHFYGTSSDQIRNDRPWSRDNRPSVRVNEWQNLDDRQSFNVQLLIAMVPEPSSPPLRYEFDSYIEVIELAAGRAGYTLDSFDLPWLSEHRRFSTESHSDADTDADEQPGPDNDNSTAATPTIDGPSSRRRKSDPSGAAKHNPWQDPGLLLFRRDDSAKGKSLLLIFVVGERPTRGVNKAALRDSLDQIAWLSGWNANTSAPAYLRLAVNRPINSPGKLRSAAGEGASEVRIIGPTFSGSALSVRNTLEEWLYSVGSAPERIRIISGTATAIGGSLDIKQPDGDERRIDFATVRIPDTAIWQLLRERFDEGSGGRPRMAVLSDDTAYGSNEVLRQNVLSITFPVHISDVRTAFGHSEMPSIPPDLIRQDLPLADETGQQERDVIPPFSGRSAAYNELRLANILSTISGEHIRYVGIVATDVEDLIFLVRQVRNYCPQAVVFTTSADLRFVHSEVNRDLIGMQVFSTYPLFSANQDWTYPFRGDRRRIQFASEESEGIFNATLASIGRPGEMRDEMVEYSEPFVPSPRAALWVGVVGHNNIWPLSVTRPKTFDHALVLKAAKQLPRIDQLVGSYPATFLVGFLILNVTFLAAAMILWRPALPHSLRPVPAPTRSWVEMLLGAAVFPEFHQERWLRISAFAGALLIAYIVGLGFFILPLRGALAASPNESAWHNLIDAFTAMSLPIQAIAVGGVFIVLPLLVVATGLAVKRTGERLTGAPTAMMPAPTGAIAGVVGTAIGFVLISVFLASVWSQQPATALFTFIRATNLWNGVSPLTPLIFLALANLCLIASDIWQLGLLEECRVESPFLGFAAGAESFRSTNEQEARVVQFLECPPWQLPFSWWIYSLLVVAFAYFWFGSGWPPVYSIDGAPFDWLFFLAALFIYVFFSILLLRFVLVWTAMHRLLRRLYWHPTRSCYETLRKSSLPERPDAQTIRLVEPRPSYTAVEFCLQRARVMLGILERPDEKSPSRSLDSSPGADKLAQTIARAEEVLSAVLAAYARDKWADALRLRVKLQREMAILAGQVAALLEPAWRMKLRGASTPSVVSPELLAEGNLFIASRVVDFIRQVLAQLRALAAFAMGGVLAMMLAISVYPFPRHNTLLWMSWIVLLSAVAICLTVFVQMNRSRILSMLSGTEPGHFNWNGAFISHLVLYAIIPVLALAGAQFPNTLGGVFSWMSGLLGGGK